MRKTFSLFVVLLMLIGISVAQSPQLVNYQSVVRDVGGSPIVNQNISLRLSVLQGSFNGTIVYQELHSVATNDFGLVNTQLGGGIASIGTFNTISWGTDEFYLRTEVDVNNGSNFSIMGSQQLVSVPYALYAGSVANGLSASSVGCADTLWTGGGSYIIIPGITEANNVQGCPPPLDPTGTYDFADACSGTNGVFDCNGTMTITADGQIPDLYLLENLGCPDQPVTAYIDGQGVVTIPSQVIFGNTTISGSGQVNGNIITITYNYELTIPTTETGTCSLELTRQ